MSDYVHNLEWISNIEGLPNAPTKSEMKTWGAKPRKQGNNITINVSGVNRGIIVASSKPHHSNNIGHKRNLEEIEEEEEEGGGGKEELEEEREEEIQEEEKLLE
ncbi:hypothetical protein G6F37_000906 [Rhizopus arrhizus]|nr:hypothetical protein G6F38_005147 [Rhizopus arrhizus]KAG1163770.1 hypothetical protein G6F37_000906 [Rhizopus arrhizus]